MLNGEACPVPGVRLNWLLQCAQTFCGWLYGQFPPGLLGNFKLGGANLLNMFRAHAAAYDAIKALPGGGEQQTPGSCLRRLQVTCCMRPHERRRDFGCADAH